MGEKLLKLMKSEGLTSSRLAEILGTGASNISHIISGRSKPGYDLLRKILLSFPRLNPDWLLLDDETMYRPTDQPGTQQPAPAGDPLQEPASPAAERADNRAPDSAAPVEAAMQDALDDFRNLTPVKRIIVIYADHTFESFTPRAEQSGR